MISSASCAISAGAQTTAKTAAISQNRPLGMNRSPNIFHCLLQTPGRFQHPNPFGQPLPAVVHKNIGTMGELPKLLGFAIHGRAMTQSHIPPTRGFALRPVAPRWPDYVLCDGLQSILQFCGARSTGLRFVSEDGQSLGVHASHFTAEEARSINANLSGSEESEIVEMVVKGQRVWHSKRSRKPSISAIPVVDEGWTVAVLELWGMGQAAIAHPDRRGVEDGVLAPRGGAAQS